MEQPEAAQQQGDDALVQSLQPILQKLESYRQDQYQGFLARGKTGTRLIIVVALVLLFLFLFKGGYGSIYIALGALIDLAIYFWVKQAKAEYQTCYKQVVMPLVARSLGLNEYKAFGSIPIDEMELTKILPSYDRYGSNDYFSGSHGGANLSFSVVTFEEEEGTEKYHYYETVFQGLALMIDLPQSKFAAHTIIINERPKLLELVNMAGSGLERVGLEDPEFTKQYSVFSTDQIEARCLLHPVMMEKILHLCTAYAANSFAMSCKGGQVFMMIGREQQLIETPPIELEVTDCAFAVSLKQELSHIVALIDYLNVYSAAAKPATD